MFIVTDVFVSFCDSVYTSITHGFVLRHVGDFFMVSKCSLMLDSRVISYIGLQTEYSDSLDNEGWQKQGKCRNIDNQ